MQTQADDRGGQRGWLGERLVDEAEVGLKTLMLLRRRDYSFAVVLAQQRENQATSIVHERC